MTSSPTKSPPAPERRKADLSVNKVIAGAGAAATAAVAGSYFGAAGTIAGAAIGSVVTTITTAAYQRSLDRTRETVHARVRIPGGRDLGVPRAESPASGTEPGLSDQPPTLPRRRWQRHGSLLVGATALIFLLAMLGVTGLELIKGSQLLGGQPGTSIGTLVRPNDSSSDGSDSDSSDSDGSDSDSGAPTPTSSEKATSTTEPPTSVPADVENGSGGQLGGTPAAPPTSLP